MPSFVPRVNNFFSFRESFSRRPSVVFLKARGAFMLPFAFEVNNFFPFRETFVSPWSQSFFFNREERLCSPLLQESTVFFVSAKFHFACVSVNRFPSSRGAFMLHPAPQVNHFFASWPNRLAQCVIPVTREKQSKQTPHLCQHKKQILLSDARKCPPEAIFTHPVPATTTHCSLPYLIHASRRTALSPNKAATFRHVANHA